MDSFVISKIANEDESVFVNKNFLPSQEDIDGEKKDMMSGNDSICHNSDSGLSIGNTTETDRDSYSASSQETITSLESFRSERSISLTLHTHNSESECERTQTYLSSNDSEHLEKKMEIVYGEHSLCNSRPLGNETLCRTTSCDNNLTDSTGDVNESRCRTSSDGASQKNGTEYEFSIAFHEASCSSTYDLKSTIEQETLTHTRLKTEDSTQDNFRISHEKSEECSIVLHEIVSMLTLPHSLFLENQKYILVLF